jgi:hypothetical protein
MTVAALLAAALGGGIIAALLDAWFTNLRAYEIARLRVIDELDSINAMNLNLQHLDIYRMAFTAEELARLRYPTGAWTEGEPVMVIRLSRDHPNCSSSCPRCIRPSHSRRPLRLSLTISTRLSRSAIVISRPPGSAS